MIGAATFFGLCAGVTGAAVLLGWIWPGFGGEYAYLSARQPASLARQAVADEAKVKIAEKVFSIYQRSTLLGGVRSLDPSDHIADGVVGVTSGWLVGYVPGFNGRFKDWIIVGPTASLYQATKVLADKRSGLIYIKIARLTPAGSSVFAEQFKVAAFTDTAETFDDILVLEDGQWYSTFLGKAVGAVSGSSYLDTAPSYNFTLPTPFKNGSLAIDGQGNVIGFVVGGSKLMPISFLTGVLEGIEERPRVTYPTLGVEGWFERDRPLFVNGAPTVGFLVNAIVAGRSGLRKGDVVLEINGRPMTFRNLWYTIGDKTVRLKVLRAGKAIELEVAVIEL